jgi:hypothetical protein
MTPLNDAVTERQPRYLNTYAVTARRGLVRRTTTDEIWWATSADGNWTYARTETSGTPWVVTYVPTGQDVLFTTLPDSRRWTARDEGHYAVAFLLAEARTVISRQGEEHTVVFAGHPGAPKPDTSARDAELAAERLGRARRWEAIHTGTLSADEPDTRCTGDACSGYLTATFAGERAAWVHADTCRECVDEAPAQRRECRNLHLHRPCGDADPVQCDHDRCTVATLPNLPTGQCPRGRTACCGCCDDDE